ncbi:MAG: hypothetical protein HFI21_13035 [Lachnospiraceae bacterium]|uniref:hypothetical protein n=1 Tax=Candidatus Merdisoma sp. JLR.KK011 TaxID=3114299 RepID=UPI002FF10BA1|nr:hypothetical protein [Lachnospiraceae bacterium]
MRKEWNGQKKPFKRISCTANFRYGLLGTGAFCISMGHALWVPFVISNRLGGAAAPREVRLLGVFLLMAGAALLIRGLEAKKWKEWGKLFLFFAILQICLSLASGLLALFVLSLSGDNGKTAKEAADLGSVVLALPVHAWMLCLAGRLLKKERFVLWFPGKLFLQFLAFCFLAALCQALSAGLPESTAGILTQGALGGCLLFAALFLMLKLTQRQLSKEEIRES